MFLHNYVRCGTLVCRVSQHTHITQAMVNFDKLPANDCVLMLPNEFRGFNIQSQLNLQQIIRSQTINCKILLPNWFACNPELRKGLCIQQFKYSNNKLQTFGKYYFEMV